MSNTAGPIDVLVWRNDHYVRSSLIWLSANIKHSALNSEDHHNVCLWLKWIDVLLSIHLSSVYLKGNSLSKWNWFRLLMIQWSTLLFRISISARQANPCSKHRCTTRRCYTALGKATHRRWLAHLRLFNRTQTNWITTLGMIVMGHGKLSKVIPKHRQRLFTPRKDAEI